MVAISADPFRIRSKDQKTTALISDGKLKTYGELSFDVETMSKEIDKLPPGLMAITLEPTIDSITTYLAALSCNRPVVILEAGVNLKNSSWLFDNYEPAVVSGIKELPTDFQTDGNFAVRQTRSKITTGCLCLTTSGSTGSPKLVRLGYAAISANALSISEALSIGPQSRAITSLPLNYSYGLSVLNSHLIAGGQIVLTDENIMSRNFWTTLDSNGCTTFAGVPYSYAILKRLRFAPQDHPSLTMMTQAGGRLDLASRRYFHQILNEVGIQFVIMYGQTEATARMTVLLHDEFEDHEESVGRVIPDGHIEIISDEIKTQENYQEGEIVYRGPNVMDQYVTNSQDFDSPSDIGGVLHTGDRGYLNDDGYLYITGRQKRIGKIHGIRINLDEVEEQINSRGNSCAVLNDGDSLCIFFEGGSREKLSVKLIAEIFRLHSSTIKTFELDEIPRISNGKIDYHSLERNV